MDIGTIITILIIIGSFIIPAIQNFRAYQEQQPGKNEPSEDHEPDFPFPDDPFEQGGETTKPAEHSPRPEAAETQHKQQKPAESSPSAPYEPEGPLPRQLLDRETAQTTEQAPNKGQPYQRPAQQSYSRKESTPYKKQTSTSYQRKQKQAYKRKKAAKKQKLKAQQHLRREQLKHFDPVQAVLYSEVINRPKYLDDPTQPPNK